MSANAMLSGSRSSVGAQDATTGRRSESASSCGEIVSAQPPRGAALSSLFGNLRGRATPSYGDLDPGGGADRVLAAVFSLPSTGSNRFARAPRNRSEALRFGFALWPVSWTRLRFSAVIRSTTALGLAVGFDLIGKPPYLRLDQLAKRLLVAVTERDGSK